MKLRKFIVILLAVVLAFTFIAQTAFAECYHAYCTTDVRSPQYCPYSTNHASSPSSTGYYYYSPAKYTLYYYPNYGSAPYFTYNGCAGYIRLQNTYRSGYSFQYWCTSPSGYGDRYYAGNNYYLNCNSRLYAIWKYNTPTNYYNYNYYAYNYYPYYYDAYDYYYDYYYGYYW